MRRRKRIRKRSWRDSNQGEKLKKEEEEIK